jgi:hypothetical protein
MTNRIKTKCIDSVEFQNNLRAVISLKYLSVSFVSPIWECVHGKIVSVGDEKELKHTATNYADT